MLASDRPAPSARPRDIDYIRVAEPAPVVLAYGIGVDSTALLVELESRGTPPDLVITGDPGIEKPETYVYQEMMAAWMAARGIRYETVRYTPKRFKHWPPYYDLLANVLTNATLPSISLGHRAIGTTRTITKVRSGDLILEGKSYLGFPRASAFACDGKFVRISIGSEYEPDAHLLYEWIVQKAA